MHGDKENIFKMLPKEPVKRENKSYSNTGLRMVRILYGSLPSIYQL